MIQRTLLAVAVAVTIASAQSNINLTAQMFNGRAWNTMNEAAKIFYLDGVRDWLTNAALGSPDARKTVEKQWAVGFVVGNYVKELDVLYRDGENLLIPIPVAIDHCTVKLKGNMTKADLENRLILLRALMH